jgi:hypothetical protein
MNVGPERDVLLAIIFGDTVPHGLGVLVSMQVRTQVAGKWAEGIRDPLVMDATTLDGLDKALPALFARLEELGMVEDDIAPAKQSIPWNAGPMYSGESLANLFLCEMFGVRYPDPTDGAAVAVVEAGWLGDPDSEKVSGEYLVSYRTLRNLAEAIPKVLRKLGRRGSPSKRNH